MKVLVLLSLILSVASCQTKNSEKTEVDNGSESTTDNLKTEDFTPLFDGSILNGWRIFKNKENNTWEVLDGTLHCKPFVEGQSHLRADIITTGQYENFELVFQWKIASKGNSGVIFRVSEEYNETYASGPEYQVIDDKDYPADLKDVQLTAGNYDMHVAENKKVNPVGEWNDGKIIANGNHVEHWLNGQKTVDYELYSEDWTARKNASKWKDYPGYATVKKGHIALQDHGDEVWYRNIGIKVIEQ